MPKGIPNSGDNKRIKTRRAYKCEACGEIIPKGTYYTRAWGLPFHGENGLVKCPGKEKM